MAYRNKHRALTHDMDIWNRLEREYDGEWSTVLNLLRTKEHEHERAALLATYLGEVSGS